MRAVESAAAVGGAGPVAAIPFSSPPRPSAGLRYVEEALASGRIGANGDLGRRCTSSLEHRTGSPRVFLTPSCTHALEMAVVLAGLGPGDEVIMPSYTFFSTATAVAMRGATPVFVDIREDTMNLDERLVEEAVTGATKAIVPVHYAGVACEMDTLLDIAARNRLMVIEDAAHGILATFHGRHLGTMGQFGCLSFDQQKNLSCGEGGALLIDDPEASRRAELVADKGSTRAAFLRGEGEYTWTDLGSSWSASEPVAGLLLAQLEEADDITRRRLRVWDSYHAHFEQAERSGRARRPVVPGHCGHNGHIYSLLLPAPEGRDGLIEALARQRITAQSHYTPLHSSPAGLRYGRSHGDLPVTERVARTLVRLPIWADLRDADVDRVAEAVIGALR
jgi:dTDP-4-amino-4,6-dideoxygalactose transaminase